MRSQRFAAWLLAFAVLLPAAHAAATPDEVALAASMNQALWPGDIVRAADRYLQSFPEGAAAPEAKLLRAQANEAWQLVARADVHLYRTAFVPDQDNANELRRAGLGSPQAAVLLAHASKATGAEQRYEGWLQYAACLGDRKASYELALYYRAVGQPLLASRYEAQAVALGYEPAPALDNLRK